MRIVVTAPGFFPHSFEGGETFVLRLAHGLKRRGHHVLVVTAKAGGDVGFSPLTERYEHEGIPVIGIPSGPDPTAFPYDARGYETWLRQTIMRIIDEFRPDLVHVNGLKPPFVRACSEMDIPHVVHTFIMPGSFVLADLFSNRIILSATIRPTRLFVYPVVVPGEGLHGNSSPAQIGTEASELARAAARGVALGAPKYPRYFSVAVNQQVARALGLAIDDEAALRERLQRLERE